MKRNSIVLLGILAMILIPVFGAAAQTTTSSDALYNSFLEARKAYFDSRSDSTISAEVVQNNYNNFIQARNNYRNSLSTVQNTDGVTTNTTTQTTTGQRLRKRDGSGNGSGNGQRLRKRDGSGMNYTDTQNTVFNRTDTVLNTNTTCDGTGQGIRKRDGSGNGQGRGKGRGRGRGNR